MQSDNLVKQISYLHDHTEISNFRGLDCITKVESLIANAVELNATAIAITDHESLSGHIKAITAMKKAKEKGYTGKLILGNEIYLVNQVFQDDTHCFADHYYHFILLAKDAIGHAQLRRLSSLAWENSFRDRGVERVPTLKSSLEEVVHENPGHLIASSACIGGELGQLILKVFTDCQDLPFNTPEENRQMAERMHTINTDEIKSFLNWCVNLFGNDFYMEMQPSDSFEQSQVNKDICALSEQYNIPTIITCDSHYRNKEERAIHASYLNSRDEEREVDAFYATTYNMTPEEIHEYLDPQIGSEQVEKALLNTNLIAAQIIEYDLAHTQIVPKATIKDFQLEHIFEAVYEKFDYIKRFAYSDDLNDKYFLYLIEQGFIEKECYKDYSPAVLTQLAQRINLELEAVWESSEKIHDKVSAYYLTALEIINMMWDDSEDGGGSLVGDSRGSIACFYTAYLIGIQQINPINYDIPYWRHLHASRPEMPDVDIDTEASKRQRIIDATKKKYGWEKVLNICTFKKEGSKSALLTSARGLGIDSDISQYLANLIPVVRGSTTSLTVMLYGDEEENIKPNTEFVNECNRYPRLLEIAQNIEGLICGRSIHASGVIIFDSHYTTLNCAMKAPNGQLITQWDMDDSSYAGGLKFDFLTITNLDAMHLCIDMLVEYGYIEWQGSLRATYDKYFHPDVIDYQTEAMWIMAERLEIYNLFQFQTQVGSQAIKRIKPRNLTQLCVANSVMRLMSGGDSTEQPLDIYVRYKEDINEWYKCMNRYLLNTEEIDVLKHHLESVSGMATMQEEVMRLVMDEKISNFSMKEANKLRKSIAKKKKTLQEEAKVMFFTKGKEAHTSDNLLNYVWNECIVPQLGYSFSLPHVLGYSIIAIQEMNMAYHYPIIFWNCANLIVDSAADEDNIGGSTNYGKIATAIANMQARGVKIALPLINDADFGFKPDIKNDRIICALKSLNGIGDEVAMAVINNRPYTSMKDFYERMVSTKIVQTAQMVKLIKAGCFLELDNQDRLITMRQFLKEYLFEPCNKLTMSQWNRMVELELFTDNIKNMVNIINFKTYVLDEAGLYHLYIDPNAKRVLPKCGYNDRWFLLDAISMEFFKQHFTEDSVVDVVQTSYVISEKKFLSEVEKKIEPFKKWLEDEQTLINYNDKLFSKLWDKHASNTLPHWEMESLSFYYTDHELKDINMQKYSISDFNKLPAIPQMYDTYTRWVKGERKEIPKFGIVRIAGTVLDSDNNKHLITLLTPTGVVTCKYNKGQYAHYSQRISMQNENGTKTVLENSWLTRGSCIIVCGYREDDLFRIYNYSDTVWKHTTNKISEIYNNGDVFLLSERARSR